MSWKGRLWTELNLLNCRVYQLINLLTPDARENEVSGFSYKIITRNPHKPYRAEYIQFQVPDHDLKKFQETEEWKSLCKLLNEMQKTESH